MLDTDELLDHRARRPMLHLVDGVATGLTWPEIELRADDRRRRSRVCSCWSGPSPTCAGTRSAAAVVDLAPSRRPDGGRAGRLPGAGAPHPAGAPGVDRPDRRSWPPRSASCAGGSTCPPACRPRSSTSSTGPGSPPSGCGRGCPTTSSAMPYPAASAALVDGLGAVAGLTIDTRTSATPRQRPRARIDELIADVRGAQGDGPPARGPGRQPRRAAAARLGPAPLGRRARGRARALPPGRGSALTPGGSPTARRAGSVRRVKVDGGIPGDLTKAAARPPGRPRRQGYDGGWTAETSHDPFFPLAARGGAHANGCELGTGIAVAFARNPMTTANVGLGPPGLQRRPLQSRPRVADQGPHREAIQHAVEPPGAPDARVRPRPAGDLGGWQNGHASCDFRGRLLHTHADDPVLRSRSRTRTAPPKVFVAAVGEGMTEVVRRGGRRDARPRLHHRALPAGGHAARARAGLRPRRDARGRTSSCPARCSSSPGAPTRSRCRRGDGTRRQIAFYGSTPAYRPVLELHGWGDLQPELNRLSKEGKWAEMGELIDDEMLRRLRRRRASPARCRPGSSSRYGDVHRPGQLLPAATTCPTRAERVLAGFHPPRPLHATDGVRPAPTCQASSSSAPR